MCNGSASKPVLLLFRLRAESDSLVTLWTVAGQAPLSTGFPRQEYWRGLPLPSPGDLPDPGIEPVPPALAGRVFTAVPPGKPQRTNTGAETPQLGNTCRVILTTGSLVNPRRCRHRSGPRQLGLRGCWA